MKKLLVLAATFILYFCACGFTYAAEDNDPDEELIDNVQTVIEQIDLSELEDYVASLTPEQQNIVGINGVKKRIKAVVSGDLGGEYSSFVSYALKLLGVDILNTLPVILSVVAIGAAFSILSSLKGRFASQSVQNVVHFACVAVLSVVLFAQISAVVASVKEYVSTLNRQMSIIFPPLLTLMTAVGASSSVAVYKPGIAILSGGIAQMITAFILPAFIISAVLNVVGNLSDGVRLNRLSGFFSSCGKWLLGTTFFLFTAFAAVQGITASVYDGVSLRTAKFAISKYIPIIGGYLSDGMNIIAAGSVLVKNALGATAVVILLVSAVPVILRVVVLSLALKLTGALIEPFGNDKLTDMVSGLSKSLTLLVSVTVAISFLYFIFIVLIICTGNLAL